MSSIIFEDCTVKRANPWSIFFNFKLRLDNYWAQQDTIYTLKFERNDIKCDSLRDKNISTDGLLKFLQERFLSEDLCKANRGMYDTRKVHQRFNELKEKKDLTYFLKSDDFQVY